MAIYRPIQTYSARCNAGSKNGITQMSISHYGVIAIYRQIHTGRHMQKATERKLVFRKGKILKSDMR